VNRYLIDAGALNLRDGAVVGLVVETACSYFKELAFPDTVVAALRVAHIGRSSVRYEVALFRGEENAAAAQGHFVHVYVDRVTRRPVELTAELRAAVEALAIIQ
jgi:acyl-CoA thioester hydrolase